MLHASARVRTTHPLPLIFRVLSRFHTATTSAGAVHRIGWCAYVCVCVCVQGMCVSACMYVRGAFARTTLRKPLLYFLKARATRVGGKRRDVRRVRGEPLRLIEKTLIWVRPSKKINPLSSRVRANERTNVLHGREIPRISPLWKSLFRLSHKFGARFPSQPAVAQQVVRGVSRNRISLRDANVGGRMKNEWDGERREGKREREKPTRQATRSRHLSA